MSTPPDTPEKPRFAFSTPTAGEAEQRQLFEGFGGAGFQGLQLKGGQYARYLNDPARFLGDWGEFDGSAAGLIYGGALDEAGVAGLRRVFDFAAAIGSEMVIFCHDRARDLVSRADLLDFARQLSVLGEESAARGVKLSLHHHFNQPVMHRDDFEVFFGAVTPGAVGLTLDTAHAVKSGVFDIAGLARDFGAHLDNVHLKDFEAGDFKTLGRGAIDFAPLFGALRAANYQGWLCADEESETAVATSLRESSHFLRANWETLA